MWVTVGNRTFSASIHSMPHAQATVANNNMDGHVCLHFYGSTTHNTNLPTYHYVILRAQRMFELYNTAVAGNRPAAPTPTPAPATVSAVPTTATVLIDGQPVAFQAFNIRGNNFFRIRDLAFALNGTPAQFALGWDGASQAITITRGVPYVPIGGEMAIVDTGTRRATPTSANIFLDGRLIRPTAYNIDGSNFFMLADLADEMGFVVEWDGVARTISVVTG